MNNIVLINEVAKLKAGASTSTGSGSLYSKLTTTGQFWTSLWNGGTSANFGPGSYNYIRIFNHGGGQFSIAAPQYAQGGGTRSEFNVLPFTVNQTTGAITTGTVTSLYTNTSTSTNSTICYGSSGSYGFAYGNLPSISGNSSSYGTIMAWTVSGNTVTASQVTQQATNDYANDNTICLTTRSGSVAYFVTNSYNGGTAYHRVWSWNGSSLNNVANSALSTSTSGQYPFPVATQFGQTLGGSTIGGVRCWQNTSGIGQFSVINNTGGIDNTVSQASLLGAHSYGYFPGAGFDLSNGNQIYYMQNGCIMVRSGSSLTDVSTTADWTPFSSSYFGHSFYPVATDKWITISDNAPLELVKFSINPSTYAVTNYGAFPISNVVGQPATDDNGYLGAHITGSNNQFVVTGNSFSEGGGIIVMAAQHNLTGS